MNQMTKYIYNLPVIYCTLNKGVPKSSGCFSLNSLVMMEDYSTRPISQLNVGENVLTIDSYGNIDKTEVITIMQYEEERMGKNKYFCLRAK